MSKVKIPLFEREATGLVRAIGPFGLMAISMSYAIGAGINFLAVDNGARYPGANVALAFIIIGIPVILVGACYALLAITMPRSGGAYLFISRTLSPTWGFIASWASWIGGWLLLGIISFYDVSFWGIMLVMVGKAFANPGLVGLGAWMQLESTSFWIGILLLASAAIISSLRTDWLIRTIQILWIIPIIGGLATMGIYAANIGLTAATFAGKWDAIMGAGAFNEVMSVATAHGFDAAKFTTFSMDSTIGVATYAAIFAYGSPATPSTSVAGEVKTPSRTQLIGTLGGVIAIVLWFTIMSGLMYASTDPFIRAYTFNFLNKYDSAYTLQPAIRPAVPLFAGILSGNLPLATFMAASAAIWLYNDMPPFFIYLSRFTFAWSFDRSFPRVFAQVHPRLHTPLYSNILVFVLGVIACALSTHGWIIYSYLPMLDQLAAWFWIFPDWIVALVAIVIPIMREDIYKTSPAAAMTILGIPIISILGLGAFFGFTVIIFMMLGVLAPGGAASPEVMFIAGAFTVGLIITLVEQYRTAKKGIPVREIFAAVPPE